MNETIGWETMAMDAPQTTVAVAHAGFDRHGLGQHHFAVVSTTVAEDRAAALLDEVRQAPYGVGTGAFDPWALTRDEKGCRLVTRLMEGLEGGYLATIRDKRPRFAKAIGTHVLEPLHQYWDEEDLAAEARRLVEDAALERMIASGASSDAICAEVDLFTRHLDSRLAATLFDRRAIPEFGVLDRLQRFMWADDEKLYDLAGQRSGTRLEDKVWLDLFRPTCHDHIRSRLTMHPRLLVSVASEATLRTITTYLLPSDIIEVALRPCSEDEDDVTVALPIETVPHTAPLLSIAKIAAVAYLHARNHEDNPALDRMRSSFARHGLAEDGSSDAPQPAERRDAVTDADPAERLGTILERYGTHASWGTPVRGYGDRKRQVAI